MTQTIKNGWSSTRRKTTRRRLAGLGLGLVSVLALAAAIAAIPAFAGHGDGSPEVTGTSSAPNKNPSCATYGLGNEFKVEPVQDGTFSTTIAGLGLVSVTLDVDEDAKSFTFDLSDNVVALVVIVKGGPFANIYDYRQAGINHDDGLVAPNNAGLSHISFCLAEAPKFGALRILKKSTKSGNPLVTTAGAAFSVTGTASFTVRDNNVGTPAGTKSDEDTTIGEVCVSGLATGSYTVNEASPPPGYGAATQTNVSYTVVADTTCATAAEISFTNAPLGEFIINYNDLGSGETSAKIDCTGISPTPADATPTAHDDDTETYTNLPAGDPPIVYSCTISVDP